MFSYIKKYLALVLTSFSFPCPVSGSDYLYMYIIFQLWLNDAFVQPHSIVFLTKFTILFCIVPTVKLASFSASACVHFLEGFALLCIITPTSISSSIIFYTRKDTQRQTTSEYGISGN